MPKTILIDGQPMGAIPTIPASRTIAEAAANQTYAAQLTYLKTYYDALNNDEKLSSKLVRSGAAIYNLNNLGGIYVNQSANTANENMDVLRLEDSTRIVRTISSAGVITYSNKSTDTNAGTLKLIVV